MTREELDVIRYVTKRIEQEQNRLDRLRDWEKRITQELDGLPHETTYKKSSVESLTTQIIDCENVIATLKAIRADCTSELIKKIDAEVDDTPRKSILVERYGFGEFFSVIAKKLHASEAYVYKLHREGLRLLGIKDKCKSAKRVNSFNPVEKQITPAI